MSDTTKVGVEFSATTAAAVTEIDKLSAAVREQTSAAGVAGKEQKALGREVALTRAAQIEAADATRKAKDLLQIHTLTVAKFGAASREATASEAKLTKATEEATRAAASAAASLEKTAKAASAAAAAEDGSLSPATKRASSQLTKMGRDAEKTSADLHKMSLQSKGTGGGFDVMGMASGKLMAVLGPAALGGTLIALAEWLGEASEKTLQYETAIANLPFALDGAQAATRGLMSESKLAVSASQALALGVVKTEAEFAQLASDSAKIALKLGTSTDQMLGDLTTALGRGSAMILDNAGIILKAGDANEAYAKSIGKTVSELDEAEKKIAFQTAAMKAIRESADATKVAYESNAAAIARLKVQAGDAWDAMERGAVNAAGSIAASAAGFNNDIAAMAASVDLMNRELMRREEWSQGFKDMASAAGLAALEVGGFQDVITHWTNVLTDPAVNEKAAAGLAMEREKRDLLAEEAHFAELQQKALEKIGKEHEGFLEAQAERSVMIGPMPAPKKKHSGAKRKAEPEMMSPGDVMRARVHDGRVDSVSNEPAIAYQEEERERLHELQLAGLEQEQEIIDARGLAEEEAQAQREALLTRRLNAEADFAKQQMRFARTDEQREKATTRMEAVEHQRRLASLRKMAAAEEAEHARKVAITEKVTARVNSLGTAMVEAAWQAAEGQRGAGLQALGDYLKTVSKQMAVKAAVETALGVSALAGIVTAGLAPGHFAAAGVALAAAVAAGGAGIGLSAAGDARAESGKGRPESAGGAAANGPGGVGSSGAGAGGGEREKRELSAQEVPISYFDPSRMPANSGTVNNYFDLSGGVWTSGGPEKAAQTMTRILRQGKAAGVR
jgi:hypothetical protein